MSEMKLYTIGRWRMVWEEIQVEADNSQNALEHADYAVDWEIMETRDETELEILKVEEL